MFLQWALYHALIKIYMIGTKAVLSKIYNLGIAYISDTIDSPFGISVYAMGPISGIIDTGNQGAVA